VVLNNLKSGTHVIRIPMVVSLERVGKELPYEPLNVQQMLYINNKLKDLALQSIGEVTRIQEKLIAEMYILFVD
jgi:hypothetical protein